MEIKEAIRTIEVAMAEVEWNYPMDYATAFEMAIAVLRAQQELEKNAPLTLGELVNLGVMAIVGEDIVYCVPMNDWVKVSKWGILFLGTDDYRSWREIEEDYGKTWLAYRRKPKEEA